MQKEINEPVTTYRAYMNHAGYEFESTATHVTDQRTRDLIGNESSVVAICHERPEFMYEMNQTDLVGADTPEQVIGLTIDSIHTNLDERLRSDDSVPNFKREHG